ncbi:MULTISPECIES: 4-hydroxyphenylacetate 3-hydroxylase family protein [unclassified Pseudofrankia]|uniref:4-hydroxyphenylacetate 3-hydroxylase family protein n=1 Tax=unclassified Pseudofrankia TaxID=2994372 RepID=UPI0008DA4C03|nr:MULTISPECIES: 4-hydroxyphenylacetate 3-hydroxylase N-terminal domain-containing protein [unclassified Pseudofrankia]MDT3441056.1 4-hydroxyphenylacetate 3-hydroxylase N-terminal domain-containing protein [Pseudofrankia sp. BMG5.37]OHV42558.1 4-hydroxyphenylacetate 3-hydroxylase [Pseudofrankia sp. BMG5.36]
MGARTGKEFLEGLLDDREVWLDGERVADVTTHPRTAGAARTLAGLFDLQHERPDQYLAVEPESGETVAVTHLIPRSAADLARRHDAIAGIARRTLGLMGRSPDYLNVTLAGFAGRPDVFRRGGNDEGTANLLAYQRHVMSRDLALTHAIVNPTVDRSLPETAAGGGEVVVHKVADTSEGIVVRGARALATLAPFADEIFVYPGYPLAEGDERYAVIFAIPMATPGLRVLCRDSYSSPAPAADAPLSSRFDEQDAVIVFDDVEVPRHRVFLDGDVDLYNRVMQRSGWTANVMQQTTIRAISKLQFAWELATRMAEAVNNTSPAAVEMLGEIWSYLELTRSTLIAAEAGAHEWGSGTWFCAEPPFAALRPTLPRWFPRVTEIIKLLGSHSLLATPTRAELANPLLRPLVERYYQGANGLPADERTALFRLAWDFVGTSLAGRSDLYERFYLGSPGRFLQLAQRQAARDADFALVASVLP